MKFDVSVISAMCAGPAWGSHISELLVALMMKPRESSYHGQ